MSRHWERGTSDEIRNARNGAMRIKLPDDGVNFGKEPPGSYPQWSQGIATLDIWKSADGDIHQRLSLDDEVFEVKGRTGNVVTGFLYFRWDQKNVKFYVDGGLFGTVERPKLIDL